FPRPMTKEVAGLVANPSMEERLARLDSQVQSNDFLKTLIQNTNMRSDPGVQDWAQKNMKRYPDMSRDDLVDLWLIRYLRQSIHVGPSGKGAGNVIEITMADYYPERARSLVQNLCAGVIEASRSTQLKLTQTTEDFSSSQLNEFRNKMVEA